MRIDVKKYLFVGPQNGSEAFFLAAQKAGIIQFEGSKESVSSSALVEQLVGAIKVLRAIPSGFTKSYLSSSAPPNIDESCQIAEAILQARFELSRIEEKISKLAVETAEAAPFGNFSFSDVEFIKEKGKKKIQFFRGKSREKAEQDSLFLVGEDKEFNYYVSFSSASIAPGALQEIFLQKSLNSLVEEKKELLEQKKRRMELLQHYTQYEPKLTYALALAVDANNVKIAQKSSSTPIEGAVFAVCGWVPENKKEKLLELASQSAVFTCEVDAGKETAPTYLENSGAARLGEELVHVYDTPSNSDKDPSLWVLIWFSIFFAMIIGDGGYGLLFLAVPIALRWRYGKFKGQLKRIWAISLLLFSSCVVWGVLAGSFFGLSLPASSSLSKYSLTHWMAEKKAGYHLFENDDVWEKWSGKYPEIKGAATGRECLVPLEGSCSPILEKFIDNIMMELALFLGSFHIITSLLRSARRNISSIGWIIFMVGAYCYLPSFLNATSMIHFIFGLEKGFAASIGFYLIWAGLAFACCAALIEKRAGGLLEPMQMIQIFSDVLSYLRIYALAMAGAIVASVINEFAYGSGWLLGGVLLVGGHLFNMVLAIMGGLIHGLRLNFLEWYRYSFEGGGKLFRPLQNNENFN